MYRRNFFLLAILLLTLNAFAQTKTQDVEAKLISSPEFYLSNTAIAAGIDGKLGLNITVDKTGAVKNVVIVYGPAWPCGKNPKKEIADVRDAVKQNVMAARFSPAIKDGKPLSTDMFITFVVGQSYRDMVKEREAEAVALAKGKPRIIESGVINGRALSLPKPEYPDIARLKRISGLVSVQILIGKEGKVISAGIVGGHTLLQSSARDAACGARFQPTSIKGELVKVSGIITYNFVP